MRKFSRWINKRFGLIVTCIGIGMFITIVIPMWGWFGVVGIALIYWGWQVMNHNHH